jgi:hypothetical protein
LIYLLEMGDGKERVEPVKGTLEEVDPKCVFFPPQMKVLNEGKKGSRCLEIDPRAKREDGRSKKRTCVGCGMKRKRKSSFGGPQGCVYVQSSTPLVADRFVDGESPQNPQISRTS